RHRAAWVTRGEGAAHVTHGEGAARLASLRFPSGSRGLRRRRAVLGRGALAARLGRLLAGGLGVLALPAGPGIAVQLAGDAADAVGVVTDGVLELADVLAGGGLRLWILRAHAQSLHRHRDDGGVVRPARRLGGEAGIHAPAADLRPQKADLLPLEEALGG